MFLEMDDAATQAASEAELVFAGRSSVAAAHVEEPGGVTFDDPRHAATNIGSSHSLGLCPICLEDVRDFCLRRQCGHVSHYRCIAHEWPMPCPECRAEPTDLDLLAASQLHQCLVDYCLLDSRPPVRRTIADWNQSPCCRLIAADGATLVEQPPKFDVADAADDATLVEQPPQVDVAEAADDATSHDSDTELSDELIAIYDGHAVDDLRELAAIVDGWA